MWFIKRVRQFVRGRIQKWGTAEMKRKLWDSEFKSGYWEFIDKTPGDFVYPYVEKYACGGTILDLGCGTGNTACEIRSGSYRDYTGVDISDVALKMAKSRSASAGRADKNAFFQSDICSFVPSRKFDVILLRESIYYIPISRVKDVLDHFSAHLEANGVFIIREHNGRVIAQLPALLGDHYKPVETAKSNSGSDVVLVLRPA